MKSDKPALSRSSIFISELADVYGWNLLKSLFLVQAVLKGFVAGGGTSGMVGTPVDFMFRERGIPASSLQVYSAAISIPWSIKPLMGLLSDVFPVMGYHRLPYMSLSALGGVAACAAVGLAPHMPLELLLICLFVIYYQVSVSDLLSEAVYSKRVREEPSRGPELVSFVWGGISLGKLVSVGVVGVVIQYINPSFAYVLALPFAGSMLLVPFFNLFEERQGPSQWFDKQAWDKDLPLFILALLVGTGSLALSVMSLFGFGLQSKVVVATSLAVLVLITFALALNPIVAKVNAFFFVQSLFGISTHGASFFFFTDTALEYPDGPHLSIVFYTTVIGLVSTVFSFAGLFAYNRWMKRWRYPKVLVVSNILGMLVNLLSCIVYLRWNCRVGLDDRFFVLASSAVQTAIMELSWLPSVLMNSQLCPKGREATMFALLAGCHNLGTNLSNYFGALLLHYLGVEPRGKEAEQDQFANLWIAALISSVGPCVPLCLLPWMIPDVTQTDTIDGVSDATAGTLWQRCCGNESRMEEVAKVEEVDSPAAVVVGTLARGPLSERVPLQDGDSD